jgi:hypothetical protein
MQICDCKTSLLAILYHVYKISNASSNGIRVRATYT